MLSAALVAIPAPGTVTVRVVESLPSYPVHNDAGATVGSTSPVQASTVELHLRSTGAGFRISAVARG